MPTPDDIKDRIREAAVEAELEHGLFADSELLVIRVPAGDQDERFGIVSVGCRRLGDDNVVVFLVAPVAGGSSLLEEGVLGDVQDVVNGLNENALFGRWVFHEEDQLVNLEHELVGDNLSSDGLRLVLEAMGRGSSDLAEFFMNVFPGCKPGIEDHPSLGGHPIDWV